MIAATGITRTQSNQVYKNWAAIESLARDSGTREAFVNALKQDSRASYSPMHPKRIGKSWRPGAEDRFSSHEHEGVAILERFFETNWNGGAGTVSGKALRDIREHVGLGLSEEVVRDALWGRTPLASERRAEWLADKMEEKRLAAWPANR